MISYDRVHCSGSTSDLKLSDFILIFKYSIKTLSNKRLVLQKDGRIIMEDYFYIHIIIV